MALLQKAYLGATPLFRNEDWFEDGDFQISGTADATLTADTTAHTKGSWTEVIASTSADTSLLVINLTAVAIGNTNTATILEIGTGAAGSETVLIPDLAIGGAHAAGNGGIAAAIPIKIPSGTRIAARIQSVVTGGKTAVISLFLVGDADYATAPTSVDTIGIDTANSKGLSMSGSSGTWVEAIASTPQAYRAIALLPSAHATGLQNLTFQFDVGVGSAGNEIAFGSVRTLYGAVVTVNTRSPNNSLFGRNIPASSRLAVRHDIGTNPDRYGVTLIGIP
jgi:hypothetical protein